MFPPAVKTSARFRAAFSAAYGRIAEEGPIAAMAPSSERARAGDARRWSTRGDGAQAAARSPAAIYMLALRQGSVDVADLARRYGVTTETIRRDLSDMQSRQLLRRVHGGAIPVERMNHEPMIEARDMVNAEEKLRIATLAVAEVPERGSVIIDSGSTGQRLAEVFPVDRDVHVVTNSLLTALTLSRRGLRDLTVLGGVGAHEPARDGR